jgi:hypothetical protein
VQQRRIARAPLLPNHKAAREQAAQPVADHPLRRLVGIGHQVEWTRFFAHIAGAQAAETRHDFRARGSAQQKIDFFRLADGEQRHEGKKNVLF